MTSLMQIVEINQVAINVLMALITGFVITITILVLMLKAIFRGGK